MRGVKGTDGVRWYWKDKSRVRLISEALPSRQIPAAIAVYDILVLLCNDAGDKRFTAHLTTICQHTGLSHRGVARAIANLTDIGLVKVSDIRRTHSGAFTPRRFEITKGPVALSDHESATGQNRLHKPSPDDTLASTCHNTPVALSASKDPVVIEEERTREKVVEEGGAQIFTNITHAERRFEELWPYQGKSAEIRLYIAEHGEENVLKAIHEASLRETELKKLSYPILKIRDMLLRQKKLGYTWHPAEKKNGVYVPAVRQQIDEEAAFFERHPLYQQLVNDLTFAPFHALNRIREVAPQFNISIDEFTSLGGVPKNEQVALIRRFVSLTLRAPTVPADA